MALGWLRASHRELDPVKSTDHQPVLTHRRSQKLEPGAIVQFDIELWASSTRFDAGQGLRLIVQGSYSLLEKALDSELKQLAKDGLPAKNIEDAKKRLTRTAIFARDGIMAPGYVYGEALSTGHKVEDVEAWPDRIKAVTPEEVNAALRALVANTNAVIGLLLPDKNASPAAREAAHKPALSHDGSIR